MNSKTFFEICEEFFDKLHPNVYEDKITEINNEEQPFDYYSYLTLNIIKFVVFILGYDENKQFLILKDKIY
jgi:hypothetical protein